jgi:dipeptidyl aminopeptidase/acylaminoacyl peptidase
MGLASVVVHFWRVLESAAKQVMLDAAPVPNSGGGNDCVPPPDAIRQQLATILRSELFSGADRLKELLNFIVTSALDGEHVKEWDIGAKVFRLKPDLDLRLDSPVRSTAWRLRRRLLEYYEGQGRQDPILITLPKGRYLPQFAYRSELRSQDNTPSLREDSMADPAPVQSAPVVSLLDGYSAEPLRSVALLRLSRKNVIVGAVVTALIGAVAAGARFIWDHVDHAPILGVCCVPLTQDGLPKFGPLLTDGTSLYFHEVIRGDLTPVSIPVHGAREAIRLSVPLRQSLLLDVAPGPRFLIRAPNTQNQMFLWEWIPGQTPKPLRESYYRAVYADGRNVIENDGTELHWLDSSRRIKTPLSVADLRWSPKQLIRFTVGEKEQRTAIWEVGASDAAPHPVSGFPPRSFGGAWDKDGRLFAFLAHSDHANASQNVSDIWAMEENVFSLWGKQPKPARLTEGPLNFLAVAPSFDGRKIFALGRAENGDLVQYDPFSKQFVPIFGHLWATETDVSRDGEWIAYVSCPDLALWKIRRNGTDRMQLTLAPLAVHEPHWSPNGSQIAFMGQTQEGRYRLYSIPSGGGFPSEIASFDSQDQGVPTWSPDGGQIVFGQLLYRKQDGEMTIQVLDLATRTLKEVPGSRGLWTPRWSPDGRFILALSPDFHRLLLFEWQTGRWRELVAMVLIDHPSWSADSSYIYFYGQGQGFSDRGLFRWSLRSRKLERILDLKEFEDAKGDYWFGVTPEGNILAARAVRVSEVYELSLK